MKKKLFVLFASVLVGCSGVEVNDLGTKFNFTEKEEIARTLAENELSLLADSGESQWTRSSVVSDLFPVYLEGKSTPSYYECKIATAGSDAGYILVNVDATDLPIVESTENGKTLTETYREKYGKDISIIRYNQFYSTVVKGVPNGGRSVNQILESVG